MVANASVRFGGPALICVDQQGIRAHTQVRPYEPTLLNWDTRVRDFVLPLGPVHLYRFATSSHLMFLKNASTMYAALFNP